MIEKNQWAIETSSVIIVPKLWQFLIDEFANLCKWFELNGSCNNLAMLEQFHVSYFGHALSKVCQYVIINDKAACELNHASIKVQQKLWNTWNSFVKENGYHHKS
jgi:hypothetical protein